MSEMSFSDPFCRLFPMTYLSPHSFFQPLPQNCRVVRIAPFNKDSYLVQNQSIIQILPESALLKIPIYLFVPDKIKNDNLIKDIIGYLKNIYSESSRRRIQERSENFH